MDYTNEKPFIAGNWKMHKTVPEALEMVQKLHEVSSELMEKVQFVVIPPFTALSEVGRVLEGSSVQSGAQNMYWEKEGAFTGEVAAPMLKDVGCTFVVIGHSERRQYFGETNETVNKKIKAALSHDLVPIMCIGETQDERESGNTMAKINSQITKGLEGLDAEQVHRIVIAYEPIWAIGTGLTATPDQAQEVHAFIRSDLEEINGNDTASCAIILYGGSVKPENTYSLLKEKDINGALVGGASLTAESFADIAREAIKAYEEK
jgi:triosephosphate isomerase